MSSIPEALSVALSTSLAAQEKIVKQTSHHESAVSNSIKNGLPHSIAVSPSHGKFLAILCKLMNAKSILEIGVLGGFSTIWFANSNPDVHVTGIEFNPKHHAVATENTQGMDNVELILGAALDVLPKLAEEGRVFDFVFIDANWDEQSQYFDWAVKMTRKGGAIYVVRSLKIFPANFNFLLKNE